MSLITRCPKCKYVRGPDDMGVPAWQCPKCGVAYAKFEEQPLGVKYSGYRPNETHFENLRNSSSSLKPGAIVIALFVLLAIVVYQLTKPTPAQIANTANQVSQQADVVLYGTQSCGYCRQARALFAYYNVKYIDKDIEASRQAYDEFRNLNARGVPVIIIGGDVIRGYSERRIIKMLKDAGKI